MTFFYDLVRKNSSLTIFMGALCLLNLSTDLSAANIFHETEVGAVCMNAVEETPADFSSADFIQKNTNILFAPMVMMSNISVCQSNLTHGTQGNANNNFGTSVTMDACTDGNYFYSFEWRNSTTAYTNTVGDLKIFDGQTATGTPIYTQAITFSAASSAINKIILEGGTGTLEFTPGNQYTFMIDPPGIGSAVVLRYRYQNSDVYSGGQLLFNGSFNASQDIYFVVETTDVNPIPTPPTIIAETNWVSGANIPHGVDTDVCGSVFVCDEGNDRIRKFDADGNFISQFGSFGTGDGQFEQPTDVATDASGNIYVADRSNHRIQKFDASGNFLMKWGANGGDGTSGNGNGEFNNPVGVEIGPSGNVYVADLNNDRIQKFDADGNFLLTWGSAGGANGQFDFGFGITVDKNENVYVADVNDKRYQKFDSNGNFIFSVGTQGAAEGELNFPFDAATDFDGNVYIPERSNHRVSVFDPDGNFLVMFGYGVQDGTAAFQTCTSGCQIGIAGSGNGQFNSPHGVAIDALGNIFVSDRGNKISKFSGAVADGGASIGGTATWTGTGGDGEWTTAANWDIGGIPNSCHDVVISINQNVTISSGTHTVKSITINGSGGDLTIDAGVTLNVDGATGDGIFVDAFDGIITNNGTINITNAGEDGIHHNHTFNNNGALSISGSGANGLFSGTADAFNNTGTVTITNSTLDGYRNQGNLTNSAAATITITDSGQDGYAIAATTAGTTANSGTITVNNSTRYSYFQRRVGSNGPGTMNLNGGTTGLWADTFGDHFTNTGTVNITNPSQFGIRVPNNGNSQYNNEAGATTTITGAGTAGVEEGVYNLNGTFTNDGDWDISNSLTANTNLEVVSGKTFNNDGSVTLSSGTFTNNGTIAGTGSFESDLANSSNGAVAPGNSPGTLTVNGNYNDGGGDFNVEIDGATCNANDILDVNGTVNLSGTLNISATNGCTPSGTDVFTIIDNDDADAITGTFSGLAEGATVNVGGTDLVISYVGGDGNDVTLSIACDISISSVAVTHEGCPDANDGTITVTASCNSCANASDIRYSIDGSTFQASNVFNSLADGTYTVTIRDVNNESCAATDAGNVINAGTDSTNPTIDCPANQTITTSGSCNGSLGNYVGMATNVTDNCGMPTVTQSPASGTSVSGTTTVTLTADDGTNTTDCTFTVSIEVNANIVVNSASDTQIAGDGQCTLREAIDNANSNTDNSGGDCACGDGNDVITFSVAGTLSPGSALPTITEGVTIDGTTAPGYVAGAPTFIIDNTGTGLTVNSGDVSIEGLSFINSGSWAGTGILIDGSTGTNTIRNCVINNKFNGIRAEGAANYVIENNDLADCGNNVNNAAIFLLTVSGTVTASGNTFGGQSNVGLRVSNRDGLSIGDETVTPTPDIVIESTSGFNTITGGQRVLYVTNGSNITIDNIDISHTGWQGTGIDISGNSGTNTIRNCTINNRYLGIYAHGAANYVIENNDLTNCGLNSGNPAIYLSPTGTVTASGNTFGGFGRFGLTVSNMDGISIGDENVTPTPDITIEDNSGFNTLGSVGTALTITGGSNITIDGIEIGGSGGGAGINLSGSDFTVQNVLVTNRVNGILGNLTGTNSITCSTFADSNDGIEFNTSVGTTTITNCNFLCLSEFGINNNVSTSVNAQMNFFASIANDGMVDDSNPLASEAGCAPAAPIADISVNEVAQGTDFGMVTVGQSSSITYTITNDGGSDLVLGAISSDDGQFSIENYTASTLSAGQTTTFDVEFTPTTVGNQSATISIVSDDCDENPYTFSVNGGGVCSISIDNVVVTDEGCPGANDGTITVTASCTTCANASDIRYSIDGSTFQVSNVFNGLEDGTYTVTIRDVNLESCTATSAGHVINAGTDSEDPTANCQDVTLTLDGTGSATLTTAQVNNSSMDNCTAAGSLTLSLDQTAFDCNDIGTSSIGLDFDGVDDYVNFGTDNIIGSSDFTAEMWVYFRRANTPEIFFAKGSPGNANNQFRFQKNSNNTISFVIDNDGFGGSQQNATTTATVSTDVWTHLAAVRDGNNLKVYINGTEEADHTNSSTHSMTGTFPLTIGSRYRQGNPDYSSPTDCIMDEVRVWSVAKTGAEINTTMNSTVSTSAPNLLRYWNLEDGSGSSVSDATGNGTDGTFTHMDAGSDWVSSDAFGGGGATVTLTVTDEATNSSTCQATITVQDTTNPTITCPANVTANTDNNLCTASGVALGTPTTDDNCAGETVSNNAPATYPVGVTTVTWTVTDASGNTATCDQTVTVTDVTDPTASCQDISVNLEAGATASITAADVNDGSSDNCGDVTLSIDISSFSCSNVGSTVSVTLTVTDDAMNSATCTANVSVTDTEAHCCDILIGSVVVSDEVCPDANDGIITINASCTSCVSILYSINGGSYQASNTFTGLAPGNYTVSVKDSGNDNCNASEFAISTGSFTETNALGAGNDAFGSVAGDINGDGHADMIVANGWNSWGGLRFYINDGSGGLVDNNAPLYVSPNTFLTAVDIADVDGDGDNDLGIGLDNHNPSYRTYLNDGSGNFTQGSTAHFGKTYDVDFAHMNADNAIDVIVTNCCNQGFRVLINDGNGNFSQQGGTHSAYVWRVAIGDADGDGDNDVYAPIWSNNESDKLFLNDGSGNLTDSGQSIGITTSRDWHAAFGDVDGDNDQDIVVANADGSPRANYVYLNDGSGNFTDSGQSLGSRTSYDVALVDLDSDGDLDAIFGNSGVEEVYENDGSGNFSLSTSMGTGQTRKISVADFNGDGGMDFNAVRLDVANNTYLNGVSTGNSSVTVGAGSDTTPPVVTCPSNVTISCDDSNPSIGTATATDNCTTVTITNDAPGSFPLGETTVTWTATDEDNNSSTCTQTVTSQDTVNPTITCPDAVTGTADNNLCTSSSISLGTATGNDNCGSPTVSNDAPANFPLGETTVTWTVTDASSNTASCTQTVTVTDDQNPVITCPGNMTADTDAGECTAAVSFTAPAGTDNCPSQMTTQVAGEASGTALAVGTHTNTYTVTDASGNTANCSFTITVSDNEDPTITCRNIDAELTASEDVVVNPADLVAASGDNCTNVTLSIDGGSVTYECSDLGAMFTITVTATDDAGNTATCDATITVTDPNEHCCDISIDDTTVAVPSCPGGSDGSITVTASCALCTSIEYSIDGGAFGSSNSFSGLAAGDYDIAVRDSGNHGCTTTQTVTVGAGVDTTAPVITCPGAQSVSADASCAGSVPDLTGLASATDNCSDPGNINITQDISAGTALTLNEATTVTLTATDEGTNTHTCDVLVTLIDDTAPDVTCPADVMMNTGANFCSASVFLTAPTATDNCSSTFTITASAGSIFIQNPFPGFYFAQFPVGTTTVTWTVTDENGQSSTCTNDVIITDDSAPSFSNCPAAPITAISDSESCGTNATWGAIFALDNCGNNLTITVSHDSGDFFPVGTTTVTYTVTDPGNNSTDCMFDVIVTDDTPPIVSCQDVEVFLDASGAASVEVADVVTGVTDNCTVDMAEVSLDISSFDCSQAGTAVTITASVNDLNGVSGSCTAEVTVTDNTDPSAVCQDVTVSLDASGMGSVDASDLDNGSDDNCPNHTIAITDGQTSYDCTDAGQSYTLTLTVTDASNNSATCTSTVGVVDDTNPTITCPSDVSVGTDAGECTAVVTFADPAGADNCSGHTVEQGEGMASGSAFPTGENTVGYTVTDASGNTATCSFTITVSDDEDPAIADCPDNITQDNDEDACNAVVNWTAPTASDNCGVDSFTSTHSSGDTFDVGTETVTYTAMDEAGNSSTCSFTVTVNDTQNPEITCPADISIGTDDNVCTAVVTYSTPSGTDNCAGQTTELVAGGASGSTFDLGETTVTYSVTDAAGNEASCSFTVTVSDDENPAITVCPDDVTIDMDSGECDGTVTDLVAGTTATDNCTASVTITQSPTAGSTFGAAHGDTQTVTITATDEAGNESTCDVVLTLNDNQDPTITACPADIVQATDADVCTAVVNWTAPTGDDNCAGTVGSSHDSGDTFDLGTTEVTYSVTDAAGNQVSCSFNVTINDEQDPAITCPTDISVGTDAGVCTAVVSYTAPVGTDNCTGATTELVAGGASGTAFDLGSTTVTYTVTDAAGNEASCSFTVTVSDDEDPVITDCADDQDVNVDVAACTATVPDLTGDVTSTDNCTGSPVITQSPAAGSTFGAAHGDTQEVTMTSTDEAGNTETCTLTLTLNDNIPPTADCVDGITVSLDENGAASITTADANDASSDNCTAANELTLSLNDMDFDCTDVAGGATVTLTVTDLASNSSTCDIAVTVLDEINPAITCPADISVGTDAGECTAVVTYSTPVGTDNCAGSTTTLAAGQASGTAFPTGTTAVTYTVTDASGNTASCSFNVTVSDDEAPTIAGCPSNISQDNDAGDCSAAVSWTAPTADDNCGVDSFTSTSQIGDTFDVGDTDVTYTAVDEAGNEHTCTFTITVVDAENPVISDCPSSQSLDNDAGECSAVATWTAPTADDNCGVTSFDSDYNSGDTFPLGATTVTYTAYDAANNYAECTFTITVSDTEDPVISCPDDIEVSNDNGICGAVVSYATPTYTDNCSSFAELMSYNSTGTYNYTVPAGMTSLTITAVGADGGNNGGGAGFGGSGASMTGTFDVNPGDQLLIIVGEAGGNGGGIRGAGGGGGTGVINTTTGEVLIAAGGGSGSPRWGNSKGRGGKADPDSTPGGGAAGNQGSGGGGFNGDGIATNCASPGLMATLAGGGNGGSPCDVGGAGGFGFGGGGAAGPSDGAGGGGGYEGGRGGHHWQDGGEGGNSYNTGTDQTNVAGVDGAGMNNDGSVSFGADIAVMQIAGLASGSTFPVGETVNTYEVTDGSGNSATCSFTVTVNDTEAPQITCPANITQDNDTGVCTAVVNWTAPVGTDNCPGAVTELQTTDYPIGATFPLGSTDVTYSVADAAGNETSCTFSVTIVDAENPVAICQDITVDLDASGAASIEAGDVNNNSTDNCNIASMSVDPRIFDCSHVGANTVTLTVVDDAGNEHTCDATVTIEDNVAPVALCQDITIDLDENGSVSIVAEDVDNTSTDACGVAGLAIDMASFDCSNLGANTVTLTVTDNNNNESTCESTVTVEDNVAPVISDCPENISVDAIATSCAASASWTEPTFSDNCGSVSSTLDTEGVATIDLGEVVFGTFPGGETTISYTVTDPQGNESICSFTVTVVDNVGPVLTGCPDDIVVDNTSGECSGQAFWTAPIPSDNCTGVTLTASHNSGESFEIGSTTVNYTASDAHGNESTCSFVVTVNDTEAPTVDCPETVEADAAGDCGYQIPDLSGLVTSSDNCEGDVTVTQSPAAGSPTPGATSVTVTVSDGTNSADCSVSITVPDDLSLSTTSTDASCDDSSDGSATVTISGGTAPYTISWSSGGSAETESGLSVGDHTVDVTDANGCTASATVTIGSNDTTPPTLFCDDHTVSLDANGEASITINDVAIVMEDNCAIASMSISQDNFTCANIGANTVTVTVTDAAGLTSTCDATVTVEDNMVSTPPFCGSTIDLQLGSDGLVSIGAGNFDPVMDNCGTALDILILGQSTFTCGFSGLSLVVPVAVLDESENFSICTVTVNITDAIAPTAVCENTTVSLGSDGTASIGASDVDGGSDDNCGIESSIVTPSSFDCGDLGANTVTLVVTDEGGLTASCTATVTVVDDSAPTPLYCDDQVSLVLDASGSASLTTANFDSAVDNCTSSPTISILGQSSFDCSDAGTTVVVAVSATDAQSNVAQCNINVSVVDNTDPVALCQDASVVADGNGIATVDASAINNASFDNCSIASMTATPNTFSCSGDSDNVVTLTVTDPSGNTATCTATVTVTGGGGAGLQANCQDVTVSLDASGNASITAADVDNGSFGCGVSLSVSPSSFTCANAGNNQVTLTATESGGGTATCTAMVMVVDDINPVASCQDISVTLDAGTGMAVIVGGDVNDGSTDNCGVDVMNVSPSVFTCEDGGDNTVTLTVTDAAGNSSTCAARVSVGYAAPTAMCQANAVTVGLGTDGTATVDPGVIDNGSSGMCDDLTMSVLPATFDCADAGSNPITLIVTDGLGQTASCTATVNIVDNSVPLPDFCGGSVNIALDADGSVNIEESGFGTHLDNCGSTPLVIISLGQINFTCADIGTTSDLLVALIDGAGNLVTCFTDVVVTDPDGHCGSGLMVNEDLLNGVQTEKAEKPQIEVWQPELDENENSLELRGLTNTPNPFSYQTKISYRLTAPAEVQMWVMDESGRMVTTLTRGAKAAGEHNVFWQPGANVAHGVYFLMVRLDNGQIAHLKMHYTR